MMGNEYPSLQISMLMAVAFPVSRICRFANSNMILVDVQLHLLFVQHALQMKGVVVIKYRCSFVWAKGTRWAFYYKIQCIS